MGEAPEWREHRIASSDGVELYARDYGADVDDQPPVLCLAGLTRNSRDFHDLAIRLRARRRVIAPDYRGRGHSGWARDWGTYRLDVELSDVVALLDHLAVPRVVLVGTSRGGLIAMLMAASHKARLAGVLLNDIGPRLEKAGLMRIASYLGQPPAGTTWEEAAQGLKASQHGFESLSEGEWMAFARRVYRDEGGRPRLDYDPALAHTFPSREAIEAGPQPELWGLFGALAGLPVTLLRGEHSDLLSESTVILMAAALPAVEAITVPGRGHAPFLDEPESLAAIERLLERAR
jgi:pimeloyl-ACP methyl ester carboxylesterase